MSLQKIGQHLRERRQSLRVKQETLAELAGISVNTLYKIERGQGNPTLQTLCQIAEVLGLELNLTVKKMPQQEP